MKRTIYLLLFVLCITYTGLSQTTGWTSHASYHNTTAVAEGNDNVFAVANGALYSYGKEDQSLRFYTKENGLSDANIDTIAYHPGTHTLLIIYSNSNIDLFTDNGIRNIPFLMNNVTIQDKEIQDISFHNNHAYLSGRFGIMALNLSKQEITDTYNIRRNVHSSIVHNDRLYAMTDEGLWYAPLTVNMVDPNNWVNVPLSSSQFNVNSVSRIISFDGIICFLAPFNGVYYLNPSGQLQYLVLESGMQDMTLQNNKLIAYTSNRAFIYSSLTAREDVNTGIIEGIASLRNNTYWVAAGNEALKGIQKNEGSGRFELFVSELNLNSPKRNLAAFMTFHNQKLLVTGGGRWLSRSDNPGTLMVYDNNSWFNFDEAKIAQQSGIRFSDVTSVVVDPQDENHYFASTWGEGVFEFKDNEFVALYNHMNSSLNSSANNSNYIRVEGLTFDSEGNLWMTNSSVNNGIKVRKADGTWTTLSDEKYSALNNRNLLDKILITQNGNKWVNNVRDPGIFIFNENGTIDDTSDDETRYITSFVTPGGEAIGAAFYYCMAEDNNGYIWIGTNLGPIYCATPYDILSNNAARAIRPLRTGYDGQPAYFLDGETVLSIAVDQGDRKWIGTQSSGVYVVNADATETIANFTTENSILPSNYISSLAINKETGEVFIGTDRGIVSYMGEQTTGGDQYSDVYAYPNPVRPEHTDRVTITGLMQNSNVKITDLNGNLIYQTRSVGADVTWNCRNKNGERVATGIYLVLASNSDAGESVVTKIMVIK